MFCLVKSVIKLMISHFTVSLYAGEILYFFYHFPGTKNRELSARSTGGRPVSKMKSSVENDG